MSVWQKHDIPENCFLLSCGVFQLELTRGVDDYMRWHNEDRIKLSLNALRPADYR